MSQKKLNLGAWTLSGIVAALAVYVWGTSLKWKIVGTSTYNIFPVLGLLAFSLMWAHYIVSVVRQYLKIDRSAIQTYFEATSWAVLIAIVLHPSLLIWQLFRDGLGLPPLSYERVYGWATILGTVSLFIFLAYEFRRQFDKRPWWRYMQYLTDLAMVAIFIHALRLGTQVHIHWFRWIWYFYGVTLAVSLTYIYFQKFKAHA